MIKTKELLLFEKALNFIKLYNGVTPLAESLRMHFKQHKKMGINDRRRFSHIVYSYFRAGRLFLHPDAESNLILSVFFLGAEENMFKKAAHAVFPFIKPADFNRSMPDKLQFLKENGVPVDESKIFPYPELLSNGVDEQAYGWSMFRKPLVYIRIRQKYHQQVLDDLRKNEYEPLYSDDQGICMGFEAATKLTVLETFEKGMFVIQDRNSQCALDDLPAIKPSEYWWDCCCGAGGKSLLFKEKFPGNRIVMSDSRKSILDNARERMHQAGYDRPEIMLLDLEENKIPEGFIKKFDGIIADVPCTGSGTWARTPEQLHFFRPFALKEHMARQETIINKIIPCLKNGGLLLYITCSVFKAENEEMVEKIKSHGLVLEKIRLLAGWNISSDTLFTALFRKT